MKVVKNGSGYKGVARIKLDEDTGKALVIVTDEDGGKTSYPIASDKVPDSLKKPDRYYVNLNSDNTEILGIRPLNVMVKVRFSHFAAGKDEKPAPKAQTGKYGPYMSMLPVLKIVEGEYKGMEIPYWMVYSFGAGEGGMTTVSGGGKAGEKLTDFLDLTGVIDEDIPFSENLLPRLQKRILAKNRSFVAALKDGNVEYLTESPDEEEDEQEADEDEDDAPVAKKNGNGKPKIPFDTDEDEQPKAKKPAKKVPSDEDGEELAKFFDDEDD